MAANKFGISLLQKNKGKVNQTSSGCAWKLFNEMFWEMGPSDVIYSIPVNLDLSLT